MAGESARRRFERILFLKHPSYRAYMLREATSLFILIYAILYVIQLLWLRDGVEGYNALLAWLTNPIAAAVNIILFMFSLIHTVSWLHLASRLAPRGGHTASPPAILKVGLYVLWLVISAIAAFLIYMGGLI